MSDSKLNLDAPVPKAVVARLSLYLRELQQVFNSGKETISSRFLGHRLDITDAQVRKDFTYFGQFGYPGIGYRCEELIRVIRMILGTNKTWPVALVGCGNLGQALLGYRGFEKQGFEVVAAFDIRESLVGSRLANLTVRHTSEMPAWVAKEKISLAILAVPAEAAKSAVETIVQSGITGILNFAPVTLNLPKHVQIVGVDLAIELEQLAFGVNNPIRVESRSTKSSTVSTKRLEKGGDPLQPAADSTPTQGMPTANPPSGNHGSPATLPNANVEPNVATDES